MFKENIINLPFWTMSNVNIEGVPKPYFRLDLIDPRSSKKQNSEIKVVRLV